MQVRLIQMIFILFLQIIATFFIRAEAMAANETILNSRSSVAFISSDGGICSGALIEKNLVITSAHCVPYLIQSKVSWYKSPEKMETADIVYIEPDSDLAFIRLHEAKDGAKPIPIISADISLKETDPVYAIGHPGAKNYQSFDSNRYNERSYLVTKGALARITDEWVISDITIYPGNSGGPLLTENGYLLGVVSRMDGRLVYSTSPQKIRESYNIAKQKTEPLTWEESESNTNFYLWAETLPVLERIGRSRGINSGEFAFDWKNRYRFSIEANMGGMSNIRIGYKKPRIGKSGSLSFIVPEFNLMSQIEYTDPNDKSRFIRHSATGFSIAFETRTSGIAVRIGALSFENNWDGYGSIGVFF